MRSAFTLSYVNCQFTSILCIHLLCDVDQANITKLQRIHNTLAWAALGRLTTVDSLLHFSGCLYHIVFQNCFSHQNDYFPIRTPITLLTHSILSTHTFIAISHSTILTLVKPRSFTIFRFVRSGR